MKGFFWRACMNFWQKYFVLLLCHSTFKMFSITVHVIIFFSVRAMEEAVGKQIACNFCNHSNRNHTEILNGHTVNHIFQYPKLWGLPKNPKSCGAAKGIVEKISQLQETGGYSSLTSKIKGVCKLNCMPFPQLDQRPCDFFYNLTFLKLHRIFFKLSLKNRKQKLSLKTHLLLQTKEL